MSLHTHRTELCIQVETASKSMFIHERILSPGALVAQILALHTHSADILRFAVQATTQDSGASEISLAEYVLKQGVCKLLRHVNGSWVELSDAKFIIKKIDGQFRLMAIMERNQQIEVNLLSERGNHLVAADRIFLNALGDLVKELKEADPTLLKIYQQKIFLMFSERSQPKESNASFQFLDEALRKLLRFRVDLTMGNKSGNVDLKQEIVAGEVDEYIMDVYANKQTIQDVITFSNDSLPNGIQVMSDKRFAVKVTEKRELEELFKKFADLTIGLTGGLKFRDNLRISKFTKAATFEFILFDQGAGLRIIVTKSD